MRDKASDKLTLIFLDVADDTSIIAATETVASAAGSAGLAGLVNNACIGIAGPLEFLPVTELRKQLEVNVIGQIAVTQSFLSLLCQGHGRIVNIGSLGGRIAFPFMGPYHASKFALEALTDSLRGELRPWRMSVSLIEPDGIATPLWEKSIRVASNTLNSLPEEKRRFYSSNVFIGFEIASAVGKAGTSADEVAKAVVHALTAARPKTRYLVGKGARIGTLVFEHLPDRLRDFLIAQFVAFYQSGQRA